MELRFHTPPVRIKDGAQSSRGLIFWRPASDFVCMAPKVNEAKLMRQFEKEKRREFIIDLWKQKKSYAQIAKAVTEVFKGPCAKATVQSVIKVFKDRPTVCDKRRSGRPPKMSKQYALLKQF